MKVLFVRALVLSAAVLLSACGGGSGGTSLMPRQLPEQPPMESPQSRSIRTTLEKIARGADSLIVSDLMFQPTNREPGQFVGPPSVPLLRGQTFCSGDTCTTSTFRGNRLSEINVSDSHELDPAYNYQRIGTVRGVAIGQFSGSETTEAGLDLSVTGFGGWLEHSYFTTSIGAIVGGGAIDGRNVNGWGSAWSLGDATGTNPVSGSATWTGVMVGGDVSTDREQGNRIQGDATLTFDFAQADLDIAFTNIQDLETSRSREVHHRDIVWQNVPVQNGRFQSGFDRSSIQGTFYGPNHEEVGGVFEAREIMGAFGATR